MSTVDLNTFFTRISEIKINDIDIHKGTCKGLNLSSANATSHFGNENSANAIDDNNATKWSNFGPSSIQTELKNKSLICNVDILWNYKHPNSEALPYEFAIYVSNYSDFSNSSILDSI